MKKETLTAIALQKNYYSIFKICILYGLCYLLFSYQNYDGIGTGIFAAASSIVFLTVANILKKNPATEDTHFSIHITKTSVFYYIAAALLPFANCLTDNAFVLACNHVGSFLLFSIASIQLVYDDKQWDFGKYVEFLLSFWVQILEVLPVPFSDYRKAKEYSDKKGMSSTTKAVLIGIACGLPLLIITTLLLVSADEVYSNLLGKIFHFSDLHFDKLAQHIIFVPIGFVAYSLLLYLVFAALTRDTLPTEIKEAKQFATPIAVTIFAMIDISYMLFCGTQFFSVFSGLLQKSEYAMYARQGFFELLFVAVINFFLVLFCNKHFARNAALKIVMTITCLCTYVMLISSAYRMLLYVRAYHLTFLRVFVLWFLAMLAFFMTGCIISIYKSTWNIFRYCLFVLTCFYIVFAFANVDSQIAQYNVTKFESDLIESKQTNTIKPYIANYLPEDYKTSKAYAPYLSTIKAKQWEILGSSNQNILSDYFSMEDLFYYYNFNGDYKLTEKACIYDKDIPETIFDWKFYNFIEAKAYKECNLYLN